MSLIKEYFDLTNKYIQEYGNNSIVLMQVGAFFEVYGLKRETGLDIYRSCIVEFSKICDLNVVDKKVCVQKEGVVMAGFKDLYLDRYIKKLQEANFTCIVYVQDEQAPNTTRSLAGIFSPGTYFSCDSEKITNHSCCIWLQLVENETNILGKWKKTKGGQTTDSLLSKKQTIYIGVSIIDIYTGKSYLFEYKEYYLHNPTTFDELERIISIYQPSETILISSLQETKMNEIVGFTNIRGSIHYVCLLEQEMNTKVERAVHCEKQIYQKKLLETFFSVPDYSIFIEPFLEKSIATQAFCYLLDFLYQHNPNLVHKIKEPIFENIGERLILANHSLKQLNMIDDEYKGKYSSVLSLLNKCITPMGKREFTHHLLNPTTNIEHLQREYDITEHCLKQGSSLHNQIKPFLQSIMDITKMTRQIMVQKMTPKTLFQFANTLNTIKNVYLLIQEDSVIRNYLTLKIPKVDSLLEYIEELLHFLTIHFEIEKCETIDSLNKLEVNFIKPHINEELDSKTELLMESQDKLEACRLYLDTLLDKYENSKKSKKANTEYIKIHETEKNNYTLIATERRCKILEEILQKESGSKTTISLSYCSSYSQERKTFELDIQKNIFQFYKQSASNKSITSYQISELCKNVSYVKIHLMELIVKVYFQVLEKIIQYSSYLETMSEFITYIDIIFTRSSIAEKYGYCKPIIKEDHSQSFVQVEDLRHCLIEHLQQSELYVANDISLGIPSVHGVLLYGTNAVGKTSFIRSLGIAVIMAQAGLYVPASSFVFKPYQTIFTRILGNDNLFKGLSTFAVEMSELRTILRMANQNSLVLGDELCSGTESISAISIFVAGIQKLHELGSSFLFATHLHEITKYEEITLLEKVLLQHMTVFYDKENDQLIYDRKLRDGAGDNMYGLEVCKSLSLPQDFLEMANAIRMKYNPQSSSLLDVKTSKYNALHLKGVCNSCGKEQITEVHHLQPQKEANEKGRIQQESLSFHKNHPANLMNLCKKCHDSFHESNVKHKKTKTNKGMILSEI